MHYYSSFKKFLNFHVAAVRRYGERKWTANDSTMEFNPTYTVSCSREETGIFGDPDNIAFLIELSNGTRFITFVRAEDYGPGVWSMDGVLSTAGEHSNSLVPAEVFREAKEKLEQFNRIKYKA